MYDTNSSAFFAFIGAYIIIFLIIAIIEIIALWKLFEKAGKPGWAAIIPIYNIYIMLEIAGLQWWWLLILLFAYLIPVIGLLIAAAAGFYIILKFVQSYGKDVGFAIGAFLLGFIFLPILAFSKDTQYIGPAGQKEVDQIIENIQQSTSGAKQAEETAEETTQATTEETTGGEETKPEE